MFLSDTVQDYRRGADTSQFHNLNVPTSRPLSSSLVINPETECAFKVLKYAVSRKDYGRLDYNAEIAHRIHSRIPDAKLDVPYIIKVDCFTFLAVIPNASEYTKFISGEPVTDITKDWHKTGKQRNRNRWINLLARKATPIEITKESEVLYLVDEHLRNLENNSEVCRFLTFSFEKEIFAYAERALQYVQTQLTKNLEHEQEMLSSTKLEIHSLLARKLPEHDSPAKQMTDNVEQQRPDFRLVSKALQNKSLQDCGIRGYCNTIDGLLLLVAEPKQRADKTGIADSIEKSLRELLKGKPKLVWVETIKMADLTSQGSKLINTETGYSGTLGCFGKDDKDSWVAITAGHFVNEEQLVHIENNNTQEEFGQCVHSHNSNDVDIAVININKTMIQRCTFQFRNEKGDICNASVYQGDQIKNWPVHKIGAATQCTSGIVYSNEANVCTEKGILINGNVNNSVFAENGDSGAIVFFYDPKDIQNRNVELLSIVSKEIDVGGGAIPVGLSRKPTLTRSLKDGLDNLPSIKIEYGSS